MHPLKLACFLLLLCLYFPTPAHAYIDPGIGSVLLQGLAAALITAMVFFKGLRDKLLSFFRKSDSRDEKKENRKP